MHHLDVCPPSCLLENREEEFEGSTHGHFTEVLRVTALHVTLCPEGEATFHGGAAYVTVTA